MITRQDCAEPPARKSALGSLKDLYDFEPAQQQWASEMAALLIDARYAASTARQAGESVLDAAVLDGLLTRYRRWPPPVCNGAPGPQTPPAASPAGSAPSRT